MKESNVERAVARIYLAGAICILPFLFLLAFFGYPALAGVFSFMVLVFLSLSIRSFLLYKRLRARNR